MNAVTAVISLNRGAPDEDGAGAFPRGYDPWFFEGFEVEAEDTLFAMCGNEAFVGFWVDVHAFGGEADFEALGFSVGFEIENDHGADDD